jgi:uncharacterized protein YcbX
VTKPRLARIRLYPIKSLDPIEVHQVSVAGGGGLVGDREFAFVDSGRNFATAKRMGERILRIRADYKAGLTSVRLSTESESAEFSILHEREALEAWMSAQFDQQVRLEQNARTGFPDDEIAGGPTVISTATIETVAAWFELEPEEIRRRFRANLEIDGLAAFEEDTLFGPEGQPRKFRIGDVEFEGINPCARCSVPGRDSLTGEVVDQHFAKKFLKLRQQHLPDGIERSAFDHYYRLSVNTKIAADQDAKRLAVGDSFVAITATETG